jgi:hypothetical protein
MKNILKYLLSLSILTGILISCNNEGVTIQEENSFSETLSLENLKTDVRMSGYLNRNKELLQGIRDINKVQELSSKGNLSNSELKQLSIAMGFDSFNSYKAYYKGQTNLLNNLEKDYVLSNYTATEIDKALFYENENYTLNARGGFCEQSCNRTFTNCMGLTTTAALMAHAGCIALEPTVIGGIVCHGIALAAQYFAQDECANQGEKCKRDCRSLLHQL